MKLLRYIFVATIIILCCAGTLNAAPTLSAGDIVILAFNGDGNDGLSFMPLVNLASGTEIFITDIGWSDASSAFLNYTRISDKIIKYTAPSAIAAGTIIRNDVNDTTNFTLVATRDGNATSYFNNISTLNSAEEILIFQGSVASPTFVFAVTDVFTGWGSSVPLSGTDTSGHGSALPSGLTNDVTALSLASGSAAIDNWAYTGPTTAATTADWKSRIANSSNWTGDDANATILTGSYTVTDATPVEQTSYTELPHIFALHQNYPNPFNPSTTFHIALPSAGTVKLVVLNMLGQEVAEVVNKHLAAGTYDFSWNAKNLSSGIYFYKLTTNQFSAVRKMTLLK